MPPKKTLPNEKEDSRPVAEATPRARPRREERKIRFNGFHGPSSTVKLCGVSIKTQLNEYQVMTWLLYPIILFEFYALLFPLLPELGQLTVGPIVLLSHLMSAWFTVAVSMTDPADPRLASTKNYLMQVRYPAVTEDAVERVGRELFKPDEELVWCFHCKTEVSKVSRHCKFCEKCVHTFDHHCKWLNNCVGSANYRYFLGVVSSTLFFTALQLGLTAWGIYMCTADEDTASDRISRFGIVTVDVANILMWIYLVLLFFIVLTIAQLFTFHLNLLYRGQTTYEFVTGVAVDRSKHRQRKPKKPRGAERVPTDDKENGGRRARKENNRSGKNTTEDVPVNEYNVEKKLQTVDLEDQNDPNSQVSLVNGDEQL